MTRSDHCPGHRGRRRGLLPLAATLAAVVSVLTALAMPAAGAAPGESPRLMEAVGPEAIGPGALVNTLGLRATTLDLAGRYVTVAAGRQRLQARTANQLFTEFGVFRDAGGRFRLLGADGGWVKLSWSPERKRYEVGTWASRWAAAWSFRLQRPAAFGDGVLHDLADMQIDSRQVVCVQAYAPLGASRGLLGVSESGVMLLRKAARCGDATSSLFITDSLRKGVDPGALTTGVRIDPITYVRFVPPDRPALTLSVDDRRLMRNEVIAYFDMLADYNDWLRNDILWAVDTTANALLGTTYTIPGDKAKDVNLAEFFVDQASYALNIIPVYGAAASGALKATYDTVELGVALAHNRNLEGPRVVESITNRVLNRSTEIHNEYDAAYSHFGQNLEDLRDSILEGCTDPDTCTSDRKLSAWMQADPMKNVTSDVQRLTRDNEVARHELAIWRKLLPIRGALFADENLTVMPDRAADTNCNPGYPLNSAYRNEEIVFAYDFLTDLRPPWALVVTGVYYPYYNNYKCFWGTTVHRAYFEGWDLGLVNDNGTVTPLGDANNNRLFNPWDPARPKAAEGTGFGLSRVDVALRVAQQQGARVHGQQRLLLQPLPLRVLRRERCGREPLPVGGQPLRRRCAVFGGLLDPGPGRGRRRSADHRSGRGFAAGPGHGVRLVRRVPRRRHEVARGRSGGQGLLHEPARRRHRRLPYPARRFHGAALHPSPAGPVGATAAQHLEGAVAAHVLQAHQHHGRDVVPGPQARGQRVHRHVDGRETAARGARRLCRGRSARQRRRPLQPLSGGAPVGPVHFGPTGGRPIPGFEPRTNVAIPAAP